MIRSLLHCIVFFVSAFLIVCVAGCSKDQISEEKRIEYYELNRLSSLNLFSTVMYNDPDNLKEELFKVVHFSDAHLSTWSHGNHIQNPTNLKEAVLFANEPASRINAMVATGDHISNLISTTDKEALTYFDVFTNALYKGNRIPTFTSTGNHDVNMMNPNINLFSLSKSVLFNCLTSKINYDIHQEGIENYYYADLPNPMGGVIRIVALDVTDQDHIVYNAQHNAILSQKQIDWLCHTALKKDMTELHSIIILIHFPLPYDDERLNTMIYNGFLHDWNMLPDIIETFRTKQALTEKYPNKMFEQDSIAVDVSFSDTPGEFICYLGGHLHTYLNYEVKCQTNSTLPKQIMIIANNMSPTERNHASHIERNENGRRNNTFNLYAIDTKSKLIHITFFGATGFYYPQVLTLNYL